MFLSLKCFLLHLIQEHLALNVYEYESRGRIVGLAIERKGDHQQQEESVWKITGPVLCLTHGPWKCLLSHRSFFSVCYLHSDMQHFEERSEMIRERIKNWGLLFFMWVIGKRNNVQAEFGHCPQEKLLSGNI